MVIALLLGCALLLLMGWRYFATRLWNQRWNTFRVAGCAFEAHLPAGRVMATGFFCDVLTLLTLGLYFPLGVVRMARLRRESLRVTALTGAIQGEQHSSAPMPVAVPEPRTHWTLALGLMATPPILAVWMKLYGKPVLSEWLVRAMPASLNTAVCEAALRQLQREGCVLPC